MEIYRKNVRFSGECWICRRGLWYEISWGGGMQKESEWWKEEMSVEVAEKTHAYEYGYKGRMSCLMRHKKKIK